jgi:hypothetical protein
MRRVVPRSSDWKETLMPVETAVAEAARLECLRQIQGLTRDGITIERAAVAMWNAEGGDRRLTWTVLSERSRHGWRRRATAALQAFDACLAAERPPAGPATKRG